MVSDSIGTFQSIVLCDDIRREDNGKLMLIGVYTGDIVSAEFPAYLSLRLFMLYDAGKSEKHRLDIVCMLDEVEALMLEGTVSQADLGYPVQMVLPPMPIDVEKPANLIVLAKAGDGSTRELLRKKIRSAEVPSL